MKKMIMVLALLAVTIGNVAFAGTGGREIDRRIRHAFEKEFSGASEVRWYAYDNYVKVDFNFNNMYLMVFYSKDGETIGVARNISFSSLPLMLQFGRAKVYKDYWITNLYEMATGDSTRYYMTLENADMSVRLVSDGSGNWELDKKEEKI